MGRAPCCEKMGLKRGAWTREEDQILVDYIQQHGHGNWRALPKQAGLLRCGKSCRLRWTNYLRPDIKRGNFTKEEEDAIIDLHTTLGNRWSAIAARLPGRTDNEIKNVWHTHLKKKLKNSTIPVTKQNLTSCDSNTTNSKFEEQENEQEPNLTNQTRLKAQQPNSPQPSSSEISSLTTTTGEENTSISVKGDSFHNFPDVDDSFWTEVFSDDNSGQFPVIDGNVQLHDYDFAQNSNGDEEMDFWYDIFTKAGDLPELPEF